MLTAIGGASFLGQIDKSLPSGNLAYVSRETSHDFLRLHQITDGGEPAESNELTPDSASGYHRVRVSGWEFVLSSGHLSTPSATFGGSILNFVEIQPAALSFPQALEDWAEITHWSIWSQLGYMIAWGALTTPKSVLPGEALELSAGDLKLGLQVG